MKMFRILILFCIPFFAFAQKATFSSQQQTATKELVKSYLLSKQSEWKLTEEDITNWTFSDMYSNKKTGTTYVYVQQQIRGIKIFNAVSSVSIKENTIKSFSKRLHANASGNANTFKPSLTAVTAIQKCAEYLKLDLKKTPKFLSSNKSVNRYYYSPSEIAAQKIRVDLVYQSINKKLRLAWDVNIRLLDESHWWNIRVDAVTGEILEKNDWTTHCDFGGVTDISSAANSSPLTSPTTPNSNTTVTTNLSSSIPSYRVFALPAESPNFGPSTLVPDPSDATASPFGWHDTNGSAGAEYTITRGNNVHAYDDIANVDAPGSAPDGGAPLLFDFPANLSQPAINYLDASITNLFYINNMVHDILYHYGFDEASGNFQETNYSGQGQGLDYVIAECQDGGGTNNANFSTPDDGQNGRMQMYLWSGAVQSVLTVNSPGTIAGNYAAVEAGFGPGISSPVTGNLAIVDDGTGVITDACEPIINGASLAGKIVLIDRGTCNFSDKVFAAENEGAIAVLVINNSAGAIFSMGGGTVNPSIPSEMISLADGNTFKNAIAGGATVIVTLNPPPTTAVDLDGSFDNGIVLHEFGHGVSNRLTGGPNNSNCLFNGEQGGEGWSDFFGLLFSIQPGDAGIDPRGIGTFALGQLATGDGIRRYPYSTDMAINPETYGFTSQSTQVHDIGEIWCSVLWDMNWALIDQFGYDADWINGTSGNNIALTLVMEGMKLQPCGPGFLDGRDAILLADDNLYGGVHKCLIWEVFARRGMGYDALQGDANVAGDETEGFDLPPLCQIPTTAPSADFQADITNSCFGTIHFSDLSTDIPQAWSWNFGDGDTSNIQNPIHTYTSPGTFTVTLKVTNTLGVDSLVRTAYINISFPTAPTYSGDTVICSGDSTTLTANLLSGNEASWYDNNNNLLFTGATFSTPALTSNTTYRLSQFTPTPLQQVGPTNTAFGSGGYHNTGFEGKLRFTTLAPMRLKSVWVDASGVANRTINLYGSTGQLLQSQTVNIPNGQSRVQLNFDIQTPGNYEIGVTAGSNLFRNSSGASYPYTINGLVSITSSNSTTNPAVYYYYLYDWEVQELPCSSFPIPVNVTISAPLSAFSFSATGLAVQFTNTSAGNIVSYHWDFGTGDSSNTQNPSYAFPTNGTYSVTFTVTDANGCSASTTQSVTVQHVGLGELANSSISIYSSGNNLYVKFANATENSQISIYDPIGKLILKEDFNTGKMFVKDLGNISAEFIMVNVLKNGNKFSEKIILLK